MFDIHNYDKEEYERERQERLAQEAFLKAQKEREESEIEEFDYHDDIEEKDNKRILLSILLVGAVGVAGYFGFNSLQDNTNQPSTPQIIKNKELNSSNQDAVKQGLITKTAQKVEEKESIVTNTQTAITTPSKENKSVVSDALLDSVKKELITTTTPKKQESTVNTNPVAPPTTTEEKLVATDTDAKNIEKVLKRQAELKREKELKRQAELKRQKELKRQAKLKRQKELKRQVKLKRQKELKRQAKLKKKRRIVIVRKGDTLASIAKKFYGNPMKFQRIVNANYSIKSSSTPLKIGQRIHVPR